MISVIVILAILTILGVAAMFKSNVQMKVSADAVHSEQALAAANAGLDQLYYEWSTTKSTELTDLANYLENGTGTRPAIYVTGTAQTYPDSFGDIGTSVTAIDNWVKGVAGVRFYTLTAAGMQASTSAQWGTGNDPQFAVWVDSYEPPATQGDYPYAAALEHDVNSTSGTCENCRIAVYALGAAGMSRRLVRETQSVLSSFLEGVSALTNAPMFGNWQEMCKNDTTSTSHGGTVSNWSNDLANTEIEVTQAPYFRDVNDANSRPSGVALASNTNIGNGGKGFRSSTSSGTQATFEAVPTMSYSGHGASPAANGMRANQASGTNIDNTAPYDNLDLLGGTVLPHNLVKGVLMQTPGQMVYFKSNNTQLFDLDAYRWGAEEFVCQDTTKADGTNGNGRYCSKAEALRTAVGSSAPVTGRLTMAEFEYNVNKGLPMFGLVRIMVPTIASKTKLNCTVDGKNYNSNFYQISSSVSSLTTSSTGGTGQYDGTVSKVDSDGMLDGTARLLVYGMAFFDYFEDLDGDDVFDPADGERLITPIESTDAYMKMEFPILINPAMPRGTMAAFPTGLASGTTVTNKINMDKTTALVNLASPIDGNFPTTEGLVVPTDAVDYKSGLAGTMRLMTNGKTYTSITMPADGLVSMTIDLRTNSGTFPPAGASSLFSTNKKALEYYYDLMVANAKHASDTWPIAPFPADVNGNFYIGQEDSVAGKNDGDMFHLFHPSGYMHGWKVALAALNMKAADWNALLTNLDTGLATQHATAKNHGDATYPQGSPFNTTIDPGYAMAANLEINQKTYFNIDATDSSGYGLLTSSWRDIPAEIYAGGLLDMHAHSNIGGVVYTPGPLEWEPGNSSYGGNSDHLAYINGAVITGFGAYVKNKYADGRYVLVYSNDAVDNISTKTVIVKRLRFNWQEVK